MMEETARMDMVQRRLRKHMEGKGLSQSDVAKAMKIKQQNVSYNLNEKVTLTFLLSYLEQYPDLDIYYLLGFPKPESGEGGSVNEPPPVNHDAARKRILAKLDDILKDEFP